MADPEFEEGEVCYKEDDKSCDPDIALSYIDTKLQNVLGHLQKDFEGGVSAENLGAKYGGYGSFLPTCQHSPSAPYRRKTPPRSQNSSITESNTLHPEDTKLQNMSGHFQYDFEGRVSAENLGAKSGEYGSFSPTYEHSPSAPSRCKTPPRSQNSNSSKSNTLHAEAVPWNCLLPSSLPHSVKDGTTCLSMPALHDPKVTSADGLGKTGSGFLSTQVSEKVRCKHEPLPTKPVNPSARKAIKIRIKMGTGNEAQKNAAIYSGLGLISPSSSMGSSPEESGEEPLKSQENVSPASILQCMTTLPITGAIPLSPLHDSLLYLTRKDLSVDTKSSTGIRSLQKDFKAPINDSASVMRQWKVLKEKNARKAGITKIMGDTKRKDGVDLEDNIISVVDKNMATKNLDRELCFSDDLKSRTKSSSVCYSGDSMNSARKTPKAQKEAEKDVPLKRKYVNKDRAKDGVILETVRGQYGAKYEQRFSDSSLVEKIGEHGVRSSEKYISVDLMGGRRTKSNKVPVAYKAESFVSDSAKGISEPVKHLKEKVDLRSTHNEQDRIELSQGKNKLLLEGRNKLKEQKSNTKLSSNKVDESLRSGIHKLKSKMSAQKDVAKLRANYEDVLDTRLGHMAKMSSSGRPSGDREKDYNLESAGKEIDMNGETRMKEFSLEIGMSTAAPGIIKEDWVFSLEIGMSTAAPGIIKEDWVQCDNCEAWRLLPQGTKADQLPENWSCSMLTWLPGKNHCYISEDETTKAVRALYQDVVESCNSIQNHADNFVGATSAVVQSFNHNYQSLGSNAIKKREKNNHENKEIQNAVSSRDLVPTSRYTRKLQEEDRPRGDLNGRNQAFSKGSMADSITSPHLDKVFGFDVETYGNKQKQKQVEEEPKKMKTKSEFDWYENRTSKRMKSEAAPSSETSGSRHMGGLDSSTCFPSRSVEKEFQKDSQVHYTKDDKHDLKGRVSISGKKKRESTMVDQDCQTLEMRTSNAREIHVKRRKLKDWQDRCKNPDAVRSNGNHLLDDMVIQEDNENSDYRKEKEPVLSKTDCRKSNISRGNDGSNKKATTTRILLFDGKNNLDVKNDQQRKHREIVTSQVTLNDIEILKKDLGYEQYSTEATSSSSKVSPSSERSSHPEVKGASVESISSSHIKMSNLGKVSSTARECLGNDHVNIGSSSSTGTPKKSLQQKIDHEGNQPGTASKGERSGVVHAEFVGCPGMSFDVHEGSSTVEDFKSVQLASCDDGVLTNHNLCPPDMHASDLRHNENIETKNIFNISTAPRAGKDYCVLTEGNVGSSYNDQKLRVKVYDNLGEQELNLENLHKDETQIAHHQVALKQEEPTDAQKHVADRSVISAKDGKNVGLKGSKIWAGDCRREIQTEIREHDASNACLGELCGIDDRAISRQNSRNENTKQSTQLELTFGRTQTISHHADLQDKSTLVSKSLKQNGFDAQLVDGYGDQSNMFRQQPGISAYRSLETAKADPTTGRDFTARKHVKGDFSGHALTVLKEAEQLRCHADNLKNHGFKSESNMAFFQAALMFLRGASLLETSNNEGFNYNGVAQLQTYANTAELFAICARDFEEHQEMAAAALAYKCMEVAYMRVLYCKSFRCDGDRHDLHATLQVVTQGESPSSCASDVDNLNNQILVDKAASIVGNRVNVAGNHPNFAWLLDITNYASSAMEASRKSLIAFAATNVVLKRALNKDGAISVKRVIDSGFHDVEEFVRLVRLANETISFQCSSGNQGEANLYTSSYSNLLPPANRAEDVNRQVY